MERTNNHGEIWFFKIEKQREDLVAGTGTSAQELAGSILGAPGSGRGVLIHGPECTQGCTLKGCGTSSAEARAWLLLAFCSFI